MRKKKIKKTALSFLEKLFHKPLLILFLLIFLPFLIWAVQQSQQLISLGTSQQPQPLDSSACPNTSTQSYSSLRVSSDSPRPGNAAQSPEINLALRGYEEVNQKLGLVDYGGDTDPIMPPSIGTMFNHIPAIVKTYQVHQWDWANNRRSPELESHYPVNLIGIATAIGEPLVGPKAGRQIGGGNVLMLIFATPTSATFVHGEGDNVGDGYFIHIDNFCVDPNLLTKYQSEDSAGRGSLPVIRTGQVFGYGNGSDVRIAIRDSGDWMDPRSKKDWWQGSDATSGTIAPSSPAVTAFPTAIPTAAFLPSPTLFTPASTNALPQLSPTSAVLPLPTKQTSQIIYNPTAAPTPTSIPSPTPTVTPAPFVDIQKTVNTAKSAWSNLIVSILQFTKVILP